MIGYRGEMIEQQIGPTCAGVQVQYVFNARYDKGAILSLWSARAEFDDDLLIMDADVLFPVALIDRLVGSELVGRLNLGPVPTNQIAWDQPHEGNLFEHLYARRAFQKAV